MKTSNSKPSDGRNVSLFTRFSHIVSAGAGKPVTFVVACLLIVVWAASGPIFHFSDTWQLVINTSTTIITFLMVFLIQNTQNRDTAALHIKLDELIVSIKGARNDIVDVEDMDEEDLGKIHTQLLERAKKAGIDEAFIEHVEKEHLDKRKK